MYYAIRAMLVGVLFGGVFAGSPAWAQVEPAVLHERDFARSPAFVARPHDVVVLELEPVARGKHVPLRGYWPSGRPSGTGDSMTGGDLFRSHVRRRDLTAHSPVILHAPHGGRAIPRRFRDAFTIGDTELESELDAMTDHRTDELAASVPNVTHVINGLSRLVVDVERFDDESEEMNAVGMGVLYTHGARGQQIRTNPDRDVPTLKGFFAEYSAELERLTDATLARHGRAVILDVHSFPAVALPYERHANEARPELCVGFEPCHASEALLAAVATAFADFERIANQPFHGSYVPTKHYRGDRRVQSVMLEIRRDVYRADEGGFTAIEEALRRLAELAV